MNLFTFLEQLTDEGLSFHLRYSGPPPTVEVEVHAHDEKWTILFGEDGLSGHMCYREARDWSEHEHEVWSLFGRMKRAWQEAARDLQITFVSPYTFSHDGIDHEVTGLLPDFGSAKGTLIASPSDADEARDAAWCSDYYTSVLNPYHYNRYDRDRFVETLRGVGMDGKGRPPAWYLGRMDS
jgi:hypothetical protein